MCTRFVLRMAQTLILVALILCSIAPIPARSQEAKYIPPPRSIADITAILDQQSPDPARVAKLRADAASEPAADLSPEVLAKFYFSRARARRLLGRVDEAIPDVEKAIAIGRKLGTTLWPRQNYLVQLENLHRNPEQVLRTLATLEREYDRAGKKGLLFNIYKWQVEKYLNLGDLGQAEARLKKSEALLWESRAWPNSQRYQSDWASQVEEPRARIMQARGRFKEAEESYRRAQELTKQTLTVAYSWPTPPVHGALELKLDSLVALGGRTKTSQGRLAEGEADVRRALLNRLKDDGRYSPDTPVFIMHLAAVLREQGRRAEAEQLARAALSTYRELGFAKDSGSYAGALNFLAETQQQQGLYEEAAETFAELDTSIANWGAKRSEGMRVSNDRIRTLYFTNQVERGIEIARLLVVRNSQRVGEKHFDTALARARLATGLSLAGRDREAMEEFRAAIPILLSGTRLNEHESSDDATQDDIRVRGVVESYVGLLARMRQAVDDAAAESFRVADMVRSRPVQNALLASSARAAVGDPVLSALVRKEQDLQKEVGAQLGLLNNALALPPERRDDRAIAEARAGVDKLRVDRSAVHAEIARKFSRYDSLIEPHSTSVDEIQAVLRPDEAVLSFYFGRQSSFVWAVPKSGPVAFADIKTTRRDIEAKIRKLRAALEPNASTLADIPPFDLALANELYTVLLAPTEASWKPAKNLIVVTNGALGALPLGLLPTSPARVDATAEPLFAGYREVSWLARTHAVTMVPSASTLVTLRRLPSSSSTRREPLVGFGDPIFSKDQELPRRQVEEPIHVSDGATSGVPLGVRSSAQFEGVATAELALLPRLPDTAEELKSIARALNTDPAKALHLGIDANEQMVKSTDLSKYKVVAFATHGLVPGELNGLTQPALALTAPDVAGVTGDGLLTMEDILGLKLDADWVVLSACNTGAASAAGAEAASGLGSAFFYAGTRAVLVTNWSVESISARTLVSDLFRRQAGDATLTRAMALKEAINALIDSPGWVDASGKTSYSYAHPLFWAPFSIIGDGG
jgi:CHAT domain-containing protein/tetratricopeptide (TPR) repeat protein